MKLSKGYDAEQANLKKEMAALQENIQQEEKQSVNVDRFLYIFKKYTHLTELTPKILHEFVNRILVHAPAKSMGGGCKRLRLSIITSVLSTIQRSLFGTEKWYSTSNAIPHILNFKNRNPC
ncbi:DUF4368 domain-containing protein [Dielma fastidiosa]|uniref:DUF4368 domain-containing protein n=1 Tax=Dielma fastidiosa TaxID=1034346 RepID=A0AB35UMB7_9FIRM|nr:DUF4368 domain-containing protein [Dielma fastidiosa]MDY5167961.1 DUF4368 domain-containing protein [Dielma fastidiosa]